MGEGFVVTNFFVTPWLINAKLGEQGLRTRARHGFEAELVKVNR